MSTSVADIRSWLEEGKRGNATHVIVVCDEFSHEDYPVYVGAGEDARTVAGDLNTKGMQRVMEVYSLALDIESQLREHRAFHYEGT